MNRTSEQHPQASADWRWWGEHELAPERWYRWRIGPLTLHARCGDHDWHLTWERGRDPLDATVECAVAATDEPELHGVEQSRHVLQDGTSRLTLAARLADRPVIARPETPVYVPPGQHALLHVSTGLWLAAGAGGLELAELPIHRPSDTWFGPNTRAGELCYASVTRARTGQAVAGYPHRAVTPVDVVNRGADALQVQQIRVPVPSLSLYVSGEGALVTDTVTLERAEGESQATLAIAEGTAHGTRLAEPREEGASGTIVHAFTRLFG